MFSGALASSLAWAAGISLTGPALRVLSYRRVHPDRCDRDTVGTGEFEWQLSYLAQSGFSFIQASDLVSRSSLPGHPVLVTFDDGYLDSVEHAVPILRRLRVKATFFIATGHVGARTRWDRHGARLADVERLSELDPDWIELALHSHTYRPFAELPLPEITAEIGNCIEFFETNDLPFTGASVRRRSSTSVIATTSCRTARFTSSTRRPGAWRPAGSGRAGRTS